MENTVTIPRERYDALIRKEYVLEKAITVSKSDDSIYGYGVEIGRALDMLFGIDRKEKAD